MPEYRSYDRDPRQPIHTNSTVSGPQPGIRRASGASRPAPRPQGARPAPRPQNRRPAGSRPPQGRRPAPRRRRRGVQPRFFAFVAVAVVLVIALVFAIGGGRDKPVEVQSLPSVAPNGGMSNVTISSQTPDPNAPQTAAPMTAPDANAFAADDEEQDNVPVISAAEQVQVSPEQLNVNTALPSEWLNVLLLGTDERNLNEPARTDTMIIASINTTTGAVKLTSLLRDTAVKFTDLPNAEYNNQYFRLNAANYFGGPLYAIKTINQCFNMNIQYYASVNFYGFTRIAEALGGIDVDLTEAEMNELNKKQYQQAKAALTAGVDESGIINETLTTYGPNTHLNGRQTLAYARIRYVDSDFARTERQRAVIVKLMEKLRGKSAAEIIALLMNLAGNVTTNMDLETVSQIAVTVLSSGLSNVDTLHLPKSGTYTIERRNDQEMIYDTDWEKNAQLLYNFIYA